MSERKTRQLHIPAYTDATFNEEITTDFVAKETTKALEAWDQLDIDNYISISVRGNDTKGQPRLGFMVTSWDDLQPGDTIAVMGKVLVVQEEKP